MSQIPLELKIHPTQRTMAHDHNHDISPTKSRLIQGNKRLNLQVKRTLEINDQVDVHLNKTFRSLVCYTGVFLTI